MVAVGYRGDTFHGSQIQPNVRTVQGTIVNSIKKIGWWSDGCLGMSSRTDAGVSVRMNLARLDLPDAVSGSVDERRVLRALNDHLPDDIVAWGAMRVPERSPSRPVISRKYYYRSEISRRWPVDVDMGYLQEVCSIFEGHHDFSNFCRVEEGRETERTVRECKPWGNSEGRAIGISVSAQSFLWNQVRRMSSAVASVISGEIEKDDLIDSLDNPQRRVDLGMDPPEGLVLWEIDHTSLGGLGLGSSPETSHFSNAPVGLREHSIWSGLCKLEMSAMIHSEWIRQYEKF